MPKYTLTFKIYRGDDLVRTDTLEQDVVKIGKLSTSHVRLDDETVSRMHAVVEVTGDDVHVIDLGSTRGTLLNGQKVNKAKLNDGDELMLGDTKIVVGLDLAAGAQVAAPAAVAPPAPRSAGAVPPPSGAASPPPPRPLTPAPVPVAATSAAAVVAASPGYGATDMDDRNAAHAIEVAAMFHDTVVSVDHLLNPKQGTVSGLTYAKLALGGALIVAGLVLTFVGQVGVAGFCLVSGVAVGVLALLRLGYEKVPPHYFIGEDPAANFHIGASALPSQLFPLVHSSGTDYGLRFTSQMGGDVTLPAGERIPLQDLARRPETQQADGAFEWPLAQGARCKVDFGDTSFLINSVHRTRPIGAHLAKTRDWSDQKWNGVSAGAHLLILLLMFSIPPDAKSLSLDLFGTDNRFVKFLIKPPEQKEEEIPDWLKKGPDDPGGKGQKHKDEEGKMGDKKSKKKDNLYALKGKSIDQQLARKLAEDAAKNAGVLGILKQQGGSQIASIFGKDSALGADAQDALGGLLGDQIGDAYGVGGLGLAGTGRGGGGTGAGTIGLGTLGTIGRGGGGGGGAGYGRGAGRLGGRRSRAPDVVPGQAVVKGSLDKEIIRRVIRRHINEVKYCYEKELTTNPDLKGRVSIQFTISGSGQVIASVVQSSDMRNPACEQCIAQAVRRWLFPKPEGGGIVIVTYPFLLTAAGE
jgi:pSer/pThr/pTyr-binding forkhead associated (FHA) protein